MNEVDDLIKSVVSGDYDSNSDVFVIDGVKLIVTVKTIKVSDFLKGELPRDFQLGYAQGKVDGIKATLCKVIKHVK